MTDWLRGIAAWGAEAVPIDAATMTDFVRQNLVALMENGPASLPACDITNGAPTTQATAFSSATSTLVRWGLWYVRAQRLKRYKRIQVGCWARVSAGTGTLRAFAARAFRVPGAAAQLPDVVSGTAAITSATGQGVNLTLDFEGENTPFFSVDDGLGAAGVPAVTYPVLYLGVQGIVDNAANTLTLLRTGGQEFD